MSSPVHSPPSPSDQVAAPVVATEHKKPENMLQKQKRRNKKFRKKPQHKKPAMNYENVEMALLRKHHDELVDLLGQAILDWEIIV
jgi:hypothetical protein